MIDIKSDASSAADYTRCSIPATHRRLAEAHRLWHQALATYRQPDAFRANLNAAIQALRNVTFVLQSEKHAFASFDDWYARWQSKLAADATAKWLIQARNTIVKQGELETTSTALVRLLTWKDDLLTESAVPPGASTALILNNLPILELLKNAEIPPGDLRTAALAIERRWSVAELQGQEILEALAHVYGLLSDLVLDAHAALNQSECIPIDSSHPDFRSAYHRTGTLECMAVGREQRTERIELASGKRYQVVGESQPVSADALEKAARRYGLGEDNRPRRWQSSDPLVVAQKILDIAKQMLQKDKSLVRMMFFRDGHGAWHQTEVYAADRTEKHILMRVVASFIERVGGDALIDVAESWGLPRDAVQELERHDIQDAPSRKEILQVLVATREGVLRTYDTPFSRGPFGGIKFSDTAQSDKHVAHYVAPVLEVWRRQGTRTEKAGKAVRELWEPDPLDVCFCGGQKRFIDCCQPVLKSLTGLESAHQKFQTALANGAFEDAERMARAALAQYVIWIRQHTAPTRHVAQELHRQLIAVDVPALQVNVCHLREALDANGHSEGFVPTLRHLSEIVGVPEIAVRLTTLAAQSLWETGDAAGAVAELKTLGTLEQVNDSLALVLATRLLDLPSDRVIELLSKAADSAFFEAEKVIAQSALATHFLSSGDRESALRVVDSIISDAGPGVGDQFSLADALSLRWEITNDDEDFHAARAALERLPLDQNWQKLASMLIDHGDYDDAEAALVSALGHGDVVAHLLAVDARLRAGKAASARELLLTVPPDSVSPDLLYPYAYTTGLVALVCNDLELKRAAASSLRKVVAVDMPVLKPAKDMLAALEDPDTFSRGSVTDRLRAFVARKSLRR